MTLVADQWPSEAEADAILSRQERESQDYAEWDFSVNHAPSIAQIVAPFGPKNFKGALQHTVALIPLEIANIYARAAEGAVIAAQVAQQEQKLGLS